MNINAIARKHTWKTMRPARCNLRAAACGILCRSTGRSTGRSSGRMGFYVCVRAIAFMFIYTQHASEITGNSVALLVEIHKKLKYVQLGAACGPWPAAKYEPIKPTHSFYFSCGLRQSMNRPLVCLKLLNLLYILEILI